MLAGGAMLLAACTSGSTGTSSSAGDGASAAAPAASAATSAAAEPAAPAEPAGQIVIANGEPITAAYYDPHSAFGLVDAQVSSLVFDTLLKMDGTGALSPNLAESFTRVSDTEVDVVVRTGVKFHDGSDVTPADVAASLNRLLDPETALAAGLYAAPGTATVDGDTVKIVTDKPFGPLENSLAVIPIVPEKDVQNPDNWKTKPTGSGPYVFVSNDGTDITLEANPDYWGTAPGIKTVVFRYIEDAEARQAALLSGQVDISTRVGPEQVAGVEGNDDFTVVSNAGPPAQIVQVWQHNGALKDLQVRQALAYAIDRETIASSVMRGMNAVGFNSIPTNMPGYQAAANAFAYDPAKARELLKEAGYDNDLTLTMATSTLVPKQLEIDQAIAGYLKDVGITVDITKLEVGKFRTSYGDYDLSLNTLATFNNDASFVLGFASGGIGTAVWKATDPTYDALFAKQRESVGDARAVAINEAATWLWDNAWTGYLSNENWVFLVNNRVKGYERAPLVGEPLLGAATVE
jgi:peptide/nickel transport system substrate-binding protein